MPKIISVFEKLNLIEKVNGETDNESVVEQTNLQSAEDEEVDVNEYYNETSEHEKYDTDNNVKEVKYDSIVSIDGIYTSFGVGNSSINTVFMLGNFINALPENLPHDVKKQTVMNIISASNTDLNKLLQDGEKRLSALKQFSEDYSNAINRNISECNAEIARLTNIIKGYEKQIQIKSTMLEEQNHTIKFEEHKINNIVNFFKNGD